MKQQKQLELNSTNIYMPMVYIVYTIIVVITNVQRIILHSGLYLCGCVFLFFHYVLWGAWIIWLCSRRIVKSGRCGRSWSITILVYILAKLYAYSYIIPVVEPHSNVNCSAFKLCITYTYCFFFARVCFEWKLCELCSRYISGEKSCFIVTDRYLFISMLCLIQLPNLRSEFLK